MRTIYGGLAAGAAGLALAGTMLTGTAGASTTGCTDGMWQAMCGDQVASSGNTGSGVAGPSWAPYTGSGQPMVGDPLVTEPDNPTDPRTDWLKVTTGDGTYFEWTPDGQTSNLCATIATPSSNFKHRTVITGGPVRLDTCDGDQYERWAVRTGPNGTTEWVSDVTGHYITAPSHEGQELTTTRTPVKGLSTWITEG